MPALSLYAGGEAGVCRVTVDGGKANLDVLGPQGRNINRVHVDLHDPERIYAGGYDDGLFRSDDGGRSWKAINRGIRYMSIWAIAQHPVTGDLWVGTEPASIFKSADHGDTWTDCSTFRDMEESVHWTFPRAPHFAHVKNIALREDDPNLVYAAIEEGWVARTTDGGRTWETLKQGVPFDAHAITLMPGRPDTVLAATGGGLFRSDNRGEKFTRSEEGIKGGFTGGGYMSPVAVHPKRPNVMFAAAADVPPPWWFTRAEGANGSFYRSDDEGRTWRRLSNGVPDGLKPGPVGCTIDPEDPDRVFWGTTDGTIWITEDGGESIRKLAEGVPSRMASLMAYRGPVAAAPAPQAPAGTKAGNGSGPQIGQEYEIEIQNEMDIPFLGPNGLSRILDHDVRIPNAKRGEKYRVKVLAVGTNNYTGRPEATIQKV
ncbi:MAG: hypothetical protein JO247_08150 [Chloroflexi bacterium]|nr:hypothetical protein [Chloroflexota bacterium]